jgi:hypothetical protein
MKNLKKVLSLVLALAMVFSLTAFAFAADATDFTDYSEIDYQQAVNVMTSIGVFNGYDDGTSFNPTGTLTREQGAKIITYMLLGQEAADKLTTTVAPFSDVPASKWSAGSIAYCSERGILAGTGDGTFNPEGTLTGQAFAKMLLIALGYDAKIQNYVGAAWAINVTADAVAAGIDVSGVALSENVTREQAAQMAFQTLEADMVRYTNKGTDITLSDGTSVNIGASSPTTIAATSQDYTPNQTTTDGKEATVQFVEQYYSDVTKDTQTYDAFGRPGTTWKNGNTSLPITTRTPVATYTASTTAATIASDLGSYKLTVTGTDGNGAAATKTLNVTNSQTFGVTGSWNAYVNGTDTGYVQIMSNRTLAANLAALTDNGKVVEIYADSNNNITEFVVVNYRVTEVSSKVTNSSRTNYVLDNRTFTDFVDPNESDTVVVNGTVEQGDVVTYAVVGGKAYIYPTTMVTGSQTSSNGSNNTIVVGGTTYTLASGVYTNGADTQQVVIGSFVNSADEATYYIDQFGYVVKTTSNLAEDYAYLAGVSVSYSGGFDGGSVTATARVVLSDGTVSTRTLAVTQLSSSSSLIGQTPSNSITGFTSPAFAANDWIITGTTINLGQNDTVLGVSRTLNATDIGNLKGGAYNYKLSDNTLTLSGINALSGVANSVSSLYTINTDTVVAQNTNNYTANGGANTVLTNSSTKFVVYSQAARTATVFTGSASLPSNIGTATAAGTTAVAVLRTGAEEAATPGSTRFGTASVVFVETATTVAGESNNFAYVDTSKVSSTLSDGTTTYTYYATSADGTEVQLTSSSVVTVDGVYTYSDANVLNADSAVTATTPWTATSRSIYSARVDESSGTVVITAGDGSRYFYSVTDNTKVVYINDNVNTINNNGGYFIREYSNGSLTNNLAVVFITVAN